MPKSPTRKVRYSTTPKSDSRWQRLIGSFKSQAAFKEYWLSRHGLEVLGKAAAGGFVFILLIFLFFARDLPNPGQVNARISATTTKFYDRTGQHLLYEVFGDKNRSIIGFNEMPQNIKDATISIEDKNFYHEGAFSIIGTLRAAVVDLACRCSAQGGSTITQQYVKNALLTDEQSFSRKIKELILSLEIDSFYSKNDILKLYLNEIPYGARAYGVQAAAKTYFNKDAKDLNLTEATMLAAIPRAPTYYSPCGSHQDELTTRQNLILDLMVQQHYIDQTTADNAKGQQQQTLSVASKNCQTNLYANITAPHFVLYVQEQLEAKYGTKAVTEGGMKIITTLDWDKQKLAEDSVKNGIKTIRALGGSNAAMVVGDPNNGQMLAMVGSYDFGDPKFGAFNVADAERQPGSSFKPFVYSTAWGKKDGATYGPGSTIYDVTTDFGGGYKPKNFTGRNYGVQSMRTALDGSLNIPAVKTLYMAGVSNSIDTAHKLGITTLHNDPGSYGLSLVLGSGEVKLTDMVNSYESFANGGLHYDPVTVLKITDGKGATLEENKPKTPSKVLDPQVAYLMGNVLSDNSARSFIFGSRSPLYIPGHTVGVKTGTTEHFNDAWTVGFTPDIAVGVWAGNNNNAPMSAEAADIAAPTWNNFMTKYLAGKPDKQFTKPDGIKTITLDANTGKLPAPNSHGPTRTDVFPSWYKPADPSTSKSAKVDKVSGKLATACTPPAAIDTAYASEIHAEIPPSDPAYGRWEPPVQGLAASLGYAQGGNLPTDSDNVHSCSDTKPTVNLSVSPLGGGTYRVSASVFSGTFPANKLDISMDDQIISTQSISGSTNYSFDYAVTSNGSHTFKAVVTDSGLYQGEDDQTVLVNDASSGGNFSGISPNGQSFPSHPASVTFSWFGGSAPYTVYLRRNGGGYSPQTPTNSNSETIPILQAGTYFWYVQAGNGSQTTPLSFTVN